MDLTPDFLLQKIPLGHWVKNGVDFLTDNFDQQFQLFSDSLEGLILATIDLLHMIPPLILIGGVMALGYFLHRNWKGSLGVGFALLLILNLGYWQQTMETVALVLFSTIISVVIGVPIGILADRLQWF